MLATPQPPLAPARTRPVEPPRQPAARSTDPAGPSARRDVFGDRVGAGSDPERTPWVAGGGRVEAPPAPRTSPSLESPAVPARAPRSDAAPLRILVEMRPAFDGHAGIPQETRLLFRGLSSLPGANVEGLIQSSNRVIAKGLPDADLSR
jgi:hypothetical protein